MNIPFQKLSFPEIYEQALVQPLFRPFAEMTLDAVSPQTGDSVLDVACGTGIVARLARERVGSSAVVGVDVSAPMLAQAARIAPEIDWREGNAQALPVSEKETFDIVVCQQGLQFFPDRLQAAREMRRVLRPGGRVGVSTWRPDEELPVLLALRRVAERQVGKIDDRRHSFGDPGQLEVLLGEAGFADVRSQVVSHLVRFEDGNVFVRLNAMALVGMSEGAKELTDARRAELVEAMSADSAALVRENTDAHGFTYELRAVVCVGTRGTPG